MHQTCRIIFLKIPIFEFVSLFTHVDFHCISEIGTDHAGIATQLQVEKALIAEGEIFFAITIMFNKSKLKITRLQ